MKTFWVISYSFPNKLEMFFNDDMGSFFLTPDINAAVQWEKFEDAKYYLEEIDRIFPDIFGSGIKENMRVKPYGFN